jgi:ATP-dependent helicase/nuclease subunit A
MESMLKTNLSASSKALGGGFGSVIQDKTLSSAAIGVAHHVFLQNVSLDRIGRAEDLHAEAERLRKLGFLSAEEAAALDFSDIRCFWNSQIGRKILAEREFLKRELAFTLRLSAKDSKVMPFLHEIPADEFVIVQGVADLAVIRSAEIWLLDFKTDQISEEELKGRASAYAPQIRLYGLALSRIYRKPVKHHWLHFLALGKTVES